MEHDDKYYRRLAVLTRFAFTSVMLVAIVVIMGLAIIQTMDQALTNLTYSHSRRIFMVVIFSVLAVLSRVPKLLSELRKIDLETPKKKPETPSPKPYAKQLAHARKKGLIDENNRLLKPRSEFVRFCIDYMYFYPYKRSDWRKLENILKDSEGKPISAAQLAQTFQDIQTREGI